MKERKRKKSTGGKYIWILIVVVAVIIGIFFLVANSKPSYLQADIDQFAKCLTENGVVEYGAFWCPNCAKQKKMFGTSFDYINYIECDARGENEQSELCIEKKVEKYPDWEFADGSRAVGVQSFEELGAKSGCPAPEAS